MGNENFESMAKEIGKINPRAGKLVRNSEKYGFQLALYAEREWPDLTDDHRAAMVALAALMITVSAG